MSLSLTEQVVIHASPTRVWAALTSPDQLTAWYAPGCRWEVPSLERGATVRFHNTEADVQRATVDVASPPARLVLRWWFDDRQPPLSIVNAFELREADGSSDCTIRQSGYEAFPPGECEEMMAQDRSALASIAASLKAFVETPAS